MKNMCENLQSEISIVKKEKDKIEVDAKKEIHDLRENLRKISHTNKELENDKIVLKQIVEANERARKKKEKVKTDSEEANSRRFDPDSWIPKYEPKGIIDIGSESESENDKETEDSENEWTEVENRRNKKKNQLGYQNLIFFLI